MPLAIFTAVFRLVLILGAIIILTPLHWLGLKINKAWGYRVGRCILSTWRRCLGHKLIVKGSLSSESPTLFVVNHSSYVDILVCGTLIPARFIAKQEVLSWPYIGGLAARQGTIYIDRKKTAISEGIKKLEEPLDKGESFILFPEGTTSDGCQVLPFGSSFFDIAIKKNATVQPVSITYAGWDGMPMPRYIRKICGWASPDISLFPHLWAILQFGSIQVVVEFHQPLKAADFSCRKELANLCRDFIQGGMVKAFSVPLLQQQ